MYKLRPASSLHSKHIRITDATQSKLWACWCPSKWTEFEFWRFPNSYSPFPPRKHQQELCCSSYCM